MTFSLYKIGVLDVSELLLIELARACRRVNGLLKHARACMFYMKLVKIA